MMEVQVKQEVKTLAEFKRWIKIGKEFIIIENAIKPYHDGSKRVVVDKNGSSICTRNEGDDIVWIRYQKANDMRFNQDNTVDFLLLEDYDDWLKEERKESGKDFWLKLKLI